MADYLLYQLGFDGEAHDYVRRVSDGATVELGRRPNYGQIITEVPDQALIVNLADPGNLNQDVGHLDLTTGALEVVPKIDGYSYVHQTFTPLDGGFFIAGTEPIFYRPGEGAFQLADINKEISSGTGRSAFSNPENVVSFGSGVLFTADDGKTVDVWYQGDPDTTALVRVQATDALGRSIFGTDIDLFGGAQLGDRFVFTADKGRFDAVYGIGAAPGSAERLITGLDGELDAVSDVEVFKGALYFTADSDSLESRFALWRTDGTAAGTRAITVDMLEAASPLAGRADDAGGIRATSRMSDPVVVGDRMFVVLLADTVAPRAGGGFDLNPLRPMIFEIRADGTPRFASEPGIGVSRDLGLDNLTLGTHVAGGRIVLPGMERGETFRGALYAVDPDTGTSERIVDRIGTIGNEVADQRYGAHGLILYAGTANADIIVTDGTAAGTFVVDERAIPSLPAGFSQPRSGFTSVSNEAIYWQTPDFKLLTPRAGAPAQLVYNDNAPENRDTSFTGRGLFEGPDNLLAILTAARGNEVIGTAGADRLGGTAADDLIEGLDGPDVLIGRGGQDTLRGGPGADVLLAEDPGDPASVGAQVYRLYQATLGRAPDTAGLRGWVEAISTGQTTLAQAATGFITSPEFTTTYGTPTELGGIGFLELLYENILGRDPDPGGQQSWLDVLRDGASTESLVLGFSESSEYRLKSAPAATAFAEAGKQSGWVDDVYRLYQATLDRTPDMAGLEGWTAALAAGRSFGSVVNGFVASPEFRQTYGTLDDSSFVTQLYQNVLGRAPDPAGLAGWLEQMAAGTARETVVTGFAQSLEFRNATAAPLQAFMQGQTGDILDGGRGRGDDILFGGIGADTFVFTAGAPGVDRVLQLDAWDRVELRGFGYADRAAALEDFTQRGLDAVFHNAASDVTAIFSDTRLEDLPEIGLFA